VRVGLLVGDGASTVVAEEVRPDRPLPWAQAMTLAEVTSSGVFAAKKSQSIPP
jgi:hypothetical protein